MEMPQNRNAVQDAFHRGRMQVMRELEQQQAQKAERDGMIQGAVDHALMNAGMQQQQPQAGLGMQQQMPQQGMPQGAPMQQQEPQQDPVEIVAQLLPLAQQGDPEAGEQLQQVLAGIEAQHGPEAVEQIMAMVQGQGQPQQQMPQQGAGLSVG